MCGCMLNSEPTDMVVKMTGQGSKTIRKMPLVVHLSRIPQCLACVTCAVVGGPCEDFHGVLHFLVKYICPKQTFSFVLAALRARTNVLFLPEYVTSFKFSGS